MADVLPTGSPTTYSGDRATATHNFNANIPSDADFVTIHYGGGTLSSGNTGVSASVDGEAATLLSAANTEGDATAGLSELWYLIAPTTGASVAVSFTINTGSTGRDLAIVVQAYKGVDAATPWHTTATPVGGLAHLSQPSITIPTEEGMYPVAAIAIQRASALATDSPATDDWEHATSAGSLGNQARAKGSTSAAQATSTTISWTASDTGNTRNWNIVGAALKPAATAPTAATISREPADIPAGEQTDTTAHVRIDTVDTTAGNTHKLWGHTSNLGEDDPDAWEASATEVDASVTTNDLVAWASRTPNTAYYFAVVSTDSGSNKTQSAVLTITTAYARPTSPTVGTITANSVTVSWADASSGVASHQLFYRESADPVSDLVLAGTVPAGETIEFEFSDLTTDTEYSFEAVAWDGDETATARYSGLVATTATPTASSIPVFAYHYRQMAVA